jgi:hypothetical protein
MTSSASNALVSAPTAPTIRDPRSDTVKTVTDYETQLTAAGLDAAAIPALAQKLHEADEKRHEDALDAWNAEQDRLRDERAAAREKQREEDGARRDKLVRRKVPEVPSVLDEALRDEDLFHIPPAFLDKLASHGLVPLSTFLPETMEAYREATRSTTLSNAVTAVTDDDGSVRWVPQAEALVPKKVVPDKDLTLSQILRAKNNMLKVLVQQGVDATHVWRWTVFFDVFDGHTLRNKPDGELFLARAIANYRLKWHEHGARGRYFNQTDTPTLEKYIADAEREIQREQWQAMKAGTVSLGHYCLER